MKFRIGKKASSNKKPADNNRPAPLDAATATAGVGKNTGGGALVTSPDHNGTENGSSKDESFFEARPWLDSDSEDDFHSVRGDFTPSRGSTPDHQRETSFTAPISVVDRSKPSLIERKQRLLELLQEKQQYDDEHDSVTDVGSEVENDIVHAEQHLKSSQQGEKVKKSSKAGCFPSSVWKLRFRSCRKKRKEQQG